MALLLAGASVYGCVCACATFVVQSGRINHRCACVCSASTTSKPAAAAVPPPAAPAPAPGSSNQPPEASSGPPAPPAVPSRAAGAAGTAGPDGEGNVGVANMGREQRRELVQRLLDEKLRRKREEAAQQQHQQQPQAGDDGQDDGHSEGDNRRGPASDEEDGHAAAGDDSQEAVPRNDQPHTSSTTSQPSDGDHGRTMSLDDFMASNQAGAAGLAAYDQTVANSPTGAVARAARRGDNSPVADSRRQHVGSSSFRDSYDNGAPEEGGANDMPYTEETFMRGSHNHSAYRHATPRAQHGADAQQHQHQQPRRRQARSASAPRGRGRTRQGADPSYSYHPEIRPLPASYGGSAQHRVEGPFEERVEKWKRRREEATRLKRKEREEDATRGCTFRPKINSNSRLTAARARGASSVPVTERLYNYAKKRLERQGVTPKRLQRRSVGDGDSSTAPSRFEEEPDRPLTLKEKQELETECTFRPKINKNRDAAPVRSRYRSQTPGRVRRTAPTGMDECTFTPHVNPVRPEMNLAQMYVRTEVFDRLSRPRAVDKARAAEAAAVARAAGGGAHGGAAAAPERPIMDMTTFMSAVGGDPAARGRRGSVQSDSDRSRSRSRSPRSSASGARRDGNFNNVRCVRACVFVWLWAVGCGLRLWLCVERAVLTYVVAVVRPQFLRRMQAKEEERKRKLEEARKPQHSHQPKISRGTKKLLASRGDSGGFLKRVEKNALRKNYDALRRKERDGGVDPHCTFKPKINESSAKRKPRSYVEMSVGDAARRETAQRLLKLKAEQDELAGLTFRPKTNRNVDVSGKLNVLSDPDSYLRRVAAEARALKERQARAASEAQMKECVVCCGVRRRVCARGGKLTLLCCGCAPCPGSKSAASDRKSTRRRRTSSASHGLWLSPRQRGHRLRRRSPTGAEPGCFPVQRAKWFGAAAGWAPEGGVCLVGVLRRGVMMSNSRWQCDHKNDGGLCVLPTSTTEGLAAATPTSQRTTESYGRRGTKNSAPGTTDDLARESTPAHTLVARGHNINVIAALAGSEIHGGHDAHILSGRSHHAGTSSCRHGGASRGSNAVDRPEEARGALAHGAHWTIHVGTSTVAGGRVAEDPALVRARATHHAAAVALGDARAARHRRLGGGGLGTRCEAARAAGATAEHRVDAGRRRKRRGDGRVAAGAGAGVEARARGSARGGHAAARGQNAGRRKVAQRRGTVQQRRLVGVTHGQRQPQLVQLRRQGAGRAGAPVAPRPVLRRRRVQPRVGCDSLQRQACRGVHGEHASQQSPQLAGDLRGPRVFARRKGREQAVTLHRGAPRRAARDHDEQEHAKGPHIGGGGGVGGGGSDLEARVRHHLRSGVGHRAGREARHGGAGGCAQRRTKVGQHRTAVQQQHVLRLDVQVVDTMAVAVAHGAHDVAEVAAGCGHREPAMLQQRLQYVCLRQLQRDPHAVVAVLDGALRRNGDDVAVGRQSCQHVRLLLTLRRMARENLHRHARPSSGDCGGMDLALGTTAKQLPDCDCPTGCGALALDASVGGNGNAEPVHGCE